MILIYFLLKFDVYNDKKTCCIFQQLRWISVDSFQLFVAYFVTNQTKTLLFLIKNNKLSICPDIQILSPLQSQLPKRTYLV